MSLLGRFLGGKDGDKKKKVSRRKSVAKNRRVPSVRKAPRRPETRKVPSSAKKSAPADRQPQIADAMADLKPAGAPVSRSSRKKRVSLKGKQLGALLIKAAVATSEQVDEGLRIQAEKGGLLGHVLQDLGFCKKSDVGAALKKQRTITTVELPYIRFEPEALELLERAFCERNRLIPFEKMGNQLCVAMANVLDTQAKNDIKEQTQLQVKVFDAAWAEIQDAIRKHLPEVATPAEEPAAVAEKEEEEELVIELPEEDLELISDVEEMPSSAGETAAAVGPAPAAPPAAAIAAPAASEPAPGEKVIIEDRPKDAPAQVDIAQAATPRKQPADAQAAPAVELPVEAASAIEEIEEIEEVAGSEEVGGLEEVAAIASEPAAEAPAPAVEAPASTRPESPEVEPEVEPVVEPASEAEASALADDGVEVVEIDDAGVIELEPAEEPEAASTPPEQAPAIATGEVAVATPEMVPPSGPEVSAQVEPPVPAVAVTVRPLPNDELPAIPMSRGYFSEVVQWGQADAERRWLAEHLADNPLPLKPGTDLMAS